MPYPTHHSPLTADCGPLTTAEDIELDLILLRADNPSLTLPNSDMLLFWERRGYEYDFEARHYVPATETAYTVPAKGLAVLAAIAAEDAITAEDIEDVNYHIAQGIFRESSQKRWKQLFEESGLFENK